MKKTRKRLKAFEADLLGFDVKPNIVGRKTAMYYVTDEQWDTVQQNRITPNERKFVETQKKINKDGEILSSIEKLQSEPIDIPENFEIIKISTSKTTSQQWIQYAPKYKVFYFDYDKILKKYTENIELVEVDYIEPITDKHFQSLTYTDVHIGMDTDKYKNSMYPILWDRDSIIKSCKDMVCDTLKARNSDTLIVDILGDFLDGYNSKTTRGGHDLPQIMTNEEAFDCALEFNLRLLDSLVPYYSSLMFNNICNDNHAGSFGYFVNKAFKEIAELKYKGVKVNNHRKFINHYFVKDIAFVISHGKDDKALKFGFKPQLDPKSIEKIDQYCKHNKIYRDSELVVFKKGDSHQALFDMCSSDDFYYFNYPALSPSSNWVQSNFKLGRRGFVIESFKDFKITIEPSFL